MRKPHNTRIGDYTLRLGVKLPLPLLTSRQNLESHSPIRKPSWSQRLQQVTELTARGQPCTQTQPLSPHLREEKTKVAGGVSNAPKAHREYRTDPGSEPQPPSYQPALLHLSPRCWERDVRDGLCIFTYGQSCLGRAANSPCREYGIPSHPWDALTFFTLNHRKKYIAHRSPHLLFCISYAKLKNTFYKVFLRYIPVFSIVPDSTSFFFFF